MRYALKAVDSEKRVVALDLDAHDEGTARELARERGYAVLVVARRLDWHSIVSAREGRFPELLFSIELLALLDAGLNVVEALQALAEKEAQAEARTVLAGLVAALHRGEALSRAVEHFPRAFSPLYVATIRSSERTGNLKQALERYVGYAEELDKVRKKVFAALLYPAILVVAGALVLAFLVFYVVPRFARVYEDLSTTLPFFSALLLAVGSWIERNAAIASLACAAAVTSGAYAMASERVRASLIQQLWRIPALGERLRVHQLARFYRTVGMLLRAGVPALKALEMVRELLVPALRVQLGQAARSLAEGRPISVAMTSAGLATPLATRLLAVGERSGAMGELMDRIARFYDDETMRFVDTFTRVFEPVLMAALGVAVGLIVLLMYMPVFELAGSLQ